MDNQSLQIKRLQKRRLQTKDFLFFFLLSVLLLTTIFFITPTKAFSSTKDLYNANTTRIQEVTIKDQNDNAIAIGEKNDFNLSITKILADLNSGTVGASQSAFFETNEDKNRGTLKNIVDVSSKIMTNTMDVVFVLDASASMSQILTDSNTFDSDGTRFAIAKQAILQLSENILSIDENNRISIVVFSSQVDYTLGLNNNIESIDDFISNLTLGRSTNYESGFNKAEELLNQRTASEQERESYVIFITDGQPNKGNTQAGVNRLKNNTNAELYCVGIQSGASDLLKSLVKDDSYFTDCNTAEEFKQYFTYLNQRFPVKQSSNIYTDLGENLSFLCNESYPITINEDSYCSLKDIPNDLFTFNQKDNQFQWNISSLAENGIRLSYYTELTEKAKNALNNNAILRVNDSTYLKYFQHYKDEKGRVQIAEETTVKSLVPYTINGQNSILTVSILSDKMGDENTLTGTTLQYGDKIKYTVKVENSGQLNADNIIIGANIPDGTEYLSASGPVSDRKNQILSSEPLTLPAGTTKEISFTVLVNIKKGEILNSGFLELNSQEYPTEYIQTQELSNPVAIYLPPATDSKPPFTSDESSVNGDDHILAKTDKTSQASNNKEKINIKVNDKEKYAFQSKIHRNPESNIGSDLGTKTQLESQSNTKILSNNPNNESAPKLLGQSTQVKSAETNYEQLLYKLLIIAIAILSTALTIQVKGIASDLRVLAWYKKKKSKIGRSPV